MDGIGKPLLFLSFAATTVFAGGMLLEVGNVTGNPEALAKHAVMLARVSACHSPEKSTVTASAEGIVDGIRRTIPLNVMPLSTAGSFAIAREWPENGTWVVRMTATNPDYKGYATGILVPSTHNVLQLAATKHYFHAVTEAEILAVLRGARTETRAGID